MLAGTDTTIWRPFGKTEAGASGVPSRTTCDPETKPEPVIVSVTAAVGEGNVIPGLDSTICNGLIAAPSETVERLPLPPGAPGLRTNAWLLAGSIATAIAEPASATFWSTLPFFRSTMAAAGLF